MKYVTSESDKEYKVGDVIKDEDRVYLVVSGYSVINGTPTEGYALVDLIDNHILNIPSDDTKILTSSLRGLTSEFSNKNETKLSGKITFDV